MAAGAAPNPAAAAGPAVAERRIAAPASRLAGQTVTPAATVTP
ncbi:hypothetical protein LAUMK7_04913 [Mycobacterium kansasii]|nr:hypothetical protein LAUMK22_04254 [Mycobacterium kansasii]VAZ68868.1 hypothetical protein LAUMK40_05024 [Mycobacterium kansasii]VAZ79634.1 hypothetical protein LAUMK7_04913 [Mycobacterium kansasii]